MTVREATVIARAADARRLGRYVIVGEVAEGGMGRIYLARVVGHGGFEKPVALKVMHQRLVERSAELAEMFLDEARVNSLVRHQNVCAVLDFGEAQGVRYLVMEYMVGQTLLEVLRRLHVTRAERESPMFWVLAARIVAEACEGLHAAHTAVDERGNPMHVVHRDISPENVFVTYDGAVKVFDFGVARASGQRHQTVVGTFKGKFAYASPEAFSAKPVDARTDIWSMGVALWETLAGAALFYRPSDAETMGAIFQEPIPLVGSIRRGCPPELDRVVQKALERDVTRRYQSAREMARDLNRFAVRAGEHVGTAEIGDFMRRLFPDEHRAAMATSHAVAKLGAAVDAAPALEGDAPPPGLVSEVRPLEDLHAQPTVIHAVVDQGRGDVASELEVIEAEAKGQRNRAAFTGPPSTVQGNPSPFDPSANEAPVVTGSRARGVPSPFE
jgi:serine/threonine-protein kinase